MCGRYSLGFDPEGYEELVQQFGVDAFSSLTPRFNVAPSQLCPIVRTVDSTRELAMSRWGLIPAWAKTAAVGFSNINARAESLPRKPAFRAAFMRRRCLVPATGFYEWKTIEGRAKQPYHIHLRESKLFAFAGLWEEWRKGEEVIGSFAIVTTVPNSLLAQIHDRAPVILERSAYELWLDSKTPTDRLEELMQPLGEDLMTADPVSSLVNKPQNDSVECTKPVDPLEPAQRSLPF